MEPLAVSTIAPFNHSIYGIQPQAEKKARRSMLQQVMDFSYKADAKISACGMRDFFPFLVNLAGIRASAPTRAERRKPVEGAKLRVKLPRMDHHADAGNTACINNDSVSCEPVRANDITS